MNISVNPRLIVKIFIWTVLVVVSANAILFFASEPFRPLLEFVHLDREANFAAWFSALMLFTSAVFAYQNGCCRRLSDPNAWVWFLSAAFFLFLSCDEGAMIHERIGNYLRLVVSNNRLGGESWVIFTAPVAFPFIAFLGWKYYAVLKELRLAKIFLISGFVVFLLGAFGCETFLFFPVYKVTPGVYRHIVCWLEETLEMSGVLMILWGLVLAHEGVKVQCP